MPNTLTLLAFDDERAAAERLAAACNATLAVIERHRFPDGELKLRLPASVPARVVMLRSLDRPNDKLVELLLAARTARQLGARHLTLVAPYLAYMRQDIAFHPGEAVSQRIVGGFLAELFDAVITVDPHLHRVATLGEAVPARAAIALSAAPLLGELAAAHCSRPILVAPDEEAEQWLVVAAQAHGFEHAVCRKVRHGDTQVDIEVPPIEVQGREIVLIDDVASTARTLVNAARQLLARGAASIDVAVTHALFAGDADAVLHAAGVRHVWSTDSIVHASNAIALAPLLGEAVAGVQAGVA